MIFIDLSKAFDTIKLENSGIKRLALRWVKSYLNEQKQYESYLDFDKTSTSSIYDVLQGSFPRLLLFYLCYCFYQGVCFSFFTNGVWKF